MMSKYQFEIDFTVLEKTLNRLTNQIWKIIPMYENEEDWEKQLNTVIIEIAGLGEIFCSNPLFLQALAKLEGVLLVKNIEFTILRKTVFETISILQELKHYETK